MQHMAALFLILLAITVQVVQGQSIHVVNVGDKGSFYDPPTVSALKGDTVNFRFTGAVHTVVQSTFANPCTPLPGGFDSGIAGTPAQTVAPISEWNLTITDDTEPIWFHCKLTQPIPHCTDGMVGTINAVTSGSNQSYELFVQAAKLLTTVPPVTATGALLSGIGAFATAAPMPRNGTNVTTTISSTSNLTSSTSTTSTSSPSFVPTPTQTQGQSSVTTGMATAEKAGIAGGVVGGAIVLILLGLLFMSMRRGQRLRREAVMIQQTFNPGASSHDMLHLGGSGILDVGPASHSRVHVHQERLGYSRSPPSVSDSTEIENKTMTAPSVSIRELAAEVAAVMRQETRHAGADSLPTVREQVADRGPPMRADSARADSARAASARTDSARAVSARTDSARAESTRTTRQLPRPPPPRGENTYSVDTLPEYARHGR